VVFQYLTHVLCHCFSFNRKLTSFYFDIIKIEGYSIMKNLDRKPTIAYVIEGDGKVISATTWFNLNKPITKDFHAPRIFENYDDLRCFCCGGTLGVSGGRKKKNGKIGDPYFYHAHKNVNCLYQEEKGMTVEQSDALKYEELKEGKKHKFYKNHVYEMLNLDKKRFVDPELEKRRYGTFFQERNWRQPDIFAICNGVKVAFEVQLQTILLAHIKGRANFYHQENTFILWLFDRREIKDYRWSDGDIFFLNNENGFFLSKETIRESRHTNRLKVGVQYHKYFLDENNELYHDTITNIIDFDKITFDQKTMQVYYYNTGKELEKLSFIGDKSLSFGFKDMYFWIELTRTNSYYLKACEKNMELMGGTFINKIGYHDSLRAIKESIYATLTSKEQSPPLLVKKL